MLVDCCAHAAHTSLFITASYLVSYLAFNQLTRSCAAHQPFLLFHFPIYPLRRDKSSLPQYVFDVAVERLVTRTQRSRLGTNSFFILYIDFSCRSQLRQMVYHTSQRHSAVSGWSIFSACWWSDQHLVVVTL